MSDMTMEEKIRARAYELWQQAGCLKGCADEYWHKARALVEKEMAVPNAAETADADARAPDCPIIPTHWSTRPVVALPTRPRRPLKRPTRADARLHRSPSPTVIRSGTRMRAFNSCT